jgi:hypothetical protein
VIRAPLSTEMPVCANIGGAIPRSNPTGEMRVALRKSKLDVVKMSNPWDIQ